MKEMGNPQWRSLYDNSFMRLEKLVPFEEQVKTPDYRFTWVMKRIQECGASILDYGCSYGVLLKLFLDKGYEAHGVDVSPKAVESANKNLPKADIRQIEPDIDILPFNTESMDIVTALEVLEHVPELNKTVKELFRVLKKGGRMYVTVPVEMNYNCQEHLRYFDFYQLVDLFKPYSSDIKVCKIFKIRPEKERRLFGVEIRK